MPGDKEAAEKSRGPTGTEHVDAEKIGGVAPLRPDWGRVERMDPDPDGEDAKREDRSGTPKRSA